MNQQRCAHTNRLGTQCPVVLSKNNQSGFCKSHRPIRVKPEGRRMMDGLAIR